MVKCYLFRCGELDYHKNPGMIRRPQTAGRHAEWFITRRHTCGSEYLPILRLHEDKIDALRKFGIRITDKLVKAVGESVSWPENQPPGIQIPGIEVKPVSMGSSRSALTTDTATS